MKRPRIHVSLFMRGVLPTLEGLVECNFPKWSLAVGSSGHHSRLLINPGHHCSKAIFLLQLNLRGRYIAFLSARMCFIFNIWLQLHSH